MRRLTASQRIAQLEHRIAQLEKRASLRRGLNSSKVEMLDKILLDFDLTETDFEEVDFREREHYKYAGIRVSLYELDFDGWESYYVVVSAHGNEQTIKGTYESYKEASSAIKKLKYKM